MALSFKPIKNQPNRRQFFGFAASGVAMLALTACASPQARITEYHYGLTPNLNALSLPTGQIKIERISANGIFAGRPIIEQVSSTPERYVETRSKLWHSSPSDLIRDALIKGWNNASERQVITSSLSAAAQYRLDIDVMTIGYGSSGQGFVKLRAVLTDANRQVLIDTHYDATGPSAADLDGSVLSIETAISEAFNALGADISAAASS